MKQRRAHERGAVPVALWFSHLMWRRSPVVANGHMWHDSVCARPSVHENCQHISSHARAFTTHHIVSTTALKSCVTRNLSCSWPHTCSSRDAITCTRW